MRKNVAGQKWRIFAFNRLTNTPVLGDAANITAKISIDFSTRIDLTDVNPTEAEDGYYYFDLSAEETNGYSVDIYPESSTTDVQVIGIPASFFLTDADEETDDEINDLKVSSRAYGPKRVKTPNLEVEQFDPLTMQKARDREGSVYPGFGDFGWTVVSPNRTKYRSRDR